MERRQRLPARVVGRYAMYDAIAVGGMATVHFGRLKGPVGFSRTVVIKRLHAQYATDDEIATMFLDEARVAARIRHPNVVPVIDVVSLGSELLLVMEYVHGESLAGLVRADARRDRARLRLVCNAVAGALHGLHAAHEATGANGQPLGVVHRDVSPQNILVGVDGTARVLDFGVAKARGQAHNTGAGQVKGKVRYLSSQQVVCGDVDRRTDLWAASVVLWEALSGRRLFWGDHDAGVLVQVLEKLIPPLHEVAPDVPIEVSRIVMRGLERDRTRRFSTALEMAAALEEAVGLLAPREVGAWVEKHAKDRLTLRRRILDEIEAQDLDGPPRAAHGFEATTDAAMVRSSLMDETTVCAPAEPRPSRRAPAVAWASAAAVVMAIAGGVGAQMLSRPRAHDRVVTAAVPVPPPSAETEVFCVAPPEPAASAQPPPAPTLSAHARPRASPPRNAGAAHRER